MYIYINIELYILQTIRLDNIRSDWIGLDKYIYIVDVCGSKTWIHAREIWGVGTKTRSPTHPTYQHWLMCQPSEKYLTTNMVKQLANYVQYYGKLTNQLNDN